MAKLSARGATVQTCKNCGLTHSTKTAKTACSLWVLSLSKHFTHIERQRRWADLLEEVRLDREMNTPK